MIVCDATEKTVRQAYCYTCLAIGGISVGSLRPKPFGPDIFGWSGGLPREGGGGGRKVRYVPRCQGNQTFWRGIPEFCRDIPEVPEKFEKRKFEFNFRSLSKQGRGNRLPIADTNPIGKFSVDMGKTRPQPTSQCRQSKRRADTGIQYRPHIADADIDSSKEIYVCMLQILCLAFFFFHTNYSCSTPTLATPPHTPTTPTPIPTAHTTDKKYVALMQGLGTMSLSCGGGRDAGNSQSPWPIYSLSP